MATQVCMIAYTTYSTDARVRREAETVASLPGYHVSVLVLQEKPERRTYLLDGVEVQELAVSKYRGKNTVRYLSSYLKFLLLAFVHCARSVRKNPPDMVHVHNMPNFLIFAAAVPRLFGARVVLDVHDTMIETYATKFSGFSSKLVGLVLRIEESICCRLADRIICTNATQRQALVSRGVPERKLTTLMNLPDPRRFEPRKLERRSSNEHGFRMVYFGTITSRLGVDLAIQAVHEIHANAPDLQFHIFGSGEDREAFRALSAGLGLEGIVHFSDGALPLDELISVVREMDLVIVPNRRSPATELMLPVKMLEGMALGLPVVAPRLTAIQRYFSDDQVFYFEPDDVHSLSCAIVDAYRDKDGRNRRADNASRFFERYAWETHKMDLVGLCRSLTASRN